MDVFELRHQLIKDYGSYVGSFIRIKDGRIEEQVRQGLDEGLLWSDPLIQLNPSFEAGDRIDELVEEGVPSQWEYPGSHSRSKVVREASF